MKNTVFIALAMSLSLSACGYSASDAVEDIKKMEVVGSNDLKNGKAITATATDPGKFTSISSVGPDDVIFKVGDAFSVSANGSAKALENLRFSLVDDNLTVGRYKYSYQMNDADKAVITITAPSISAISAAGSGDVKAERVNGPKVSLSSAGSGNVTLAGKVDTAAYSIAGSGAIDATKMASSSASVSIAGSGNVNLTASGKVSADIAGSGDVNVTGGATCTSSIVGSGKLNCG